MKEAAVTGQTSFIELYNGYLRYYMHIPEPDKLDDMEWAGMVKMLEYIKKKEQEAGKKEQ